MSVALYIDYENGESQDFRVCCQDAVKFWEQVADQFQFEFFGRGLPIPVFPESIHQVVRESQLLREAILNDMRSLNCSDEDYTTEKERLDAWVDALAELRHLKGWGVSLG